MLPLPYPSLTNERLLTRNPFRRRRATAGLPMGTCQAGKLQAFTAKLCLTTATSFEAEAQSTICLRDSPLVVSCPHPSQQLAVSFQTRTLHCNSCAWVMYRTFPTVVHLPPLRTTLLVEKPKPLRRVKKARTMRKSRNCQSHNTSQRETTYQVRAGRSRRCWRRTFAVTVLRVARMTTTTTLSRVRAMR